MQYPSQSFQIENLHQFRSILQEISLENEQSIKEYLTPLLEDQDVRIKKTATICIEELTKKEQSLNNVVEFSLHLLNELQTKNDSLSRVNDQLTKLSMDFDKLLMSNEQLTQKMELIEDENYQFKNKILQAQTYMSEVSQNQTIKSIVESEINIHSIQISGFSKKYSHLTQRPYLTNSNSVPIEEFNKKIDQFQQKLQYKSLWISQFQKEIRELKERIFSLQNQISMKSSQLQLSELYFKEKLDIIAHNETFNRSHEVSISQIQLNSIFKKDLLRVNSSKSIESFIESQSSQNSENYHDHFKLILEEQTTYKRNNIVRRSLMQDFVTDFAIQAHGSLYSSILDQQSMSPDSSCIMRGRKKSISASTADMKKTSSKGVQTSFDPVTKIIKRTSNKYNSKPIQKKECHETSFLGLGSISSIFSKKEIPKQKSICEQIEKQVQQKSEYSILGESSIGDIFKGILDYATKKIVTNRVHKKNKVNLNQSFTKQLNKAVPNKKNYIKGMKY